MKGLGKRHLKRMMVGLLLTSMLLLAGCGSKSGSMDAAASEEAKAAMTEEAYTSASTNGAGMDVYYEAGEMDTATMDGGTAADVNMKEPAENNSTMAPVDTGRKLIKTVDMNVETQNFDELMSTIQSRVSELGGYIENMNTYNGSAYYGGNSTRNADMTIRIPKDELDGFLNTVSGISNVVRRSDSVEDITLAYVDLESHKNALRTEQERLLSFLEQAETIEEIITIEQRLSDVRYQLESMESRLRTYDNQVDYSTIYLYVEEVEIFTPVEEETVGERISAGFMESLDNIGTGFVEFGIWFVVHIPYLVMWAILITVVILIIVWKTRRSRKSARSKEADRSIEDNKSNTDN